MATLLEGRMKTISKALENISATNTWGPYTFGNVKTASLQFTERIKFWLWPDKYTPNSAWFSNRNVIDFLRNYVDVVNIQRNTRKNISDYAV